MFSAPPPLASNVRRTASPARCSCAGSRACCRRCCGARAPAPPRSTSASRPSRYPRATPRLHGLLEATVDEMHVLAHLREHHGEAGVLADRHAVALPRCRRSRAAGPRTSRPTSLSSASRAARSAARTSSGRSQLAATHIAATASVISPTSRSRIRALQPPSGPESRARRGARGRRATQPPPVSPCCARPYA